jgi:hypothetical protein
VIGINPEYFWDIMTVEEVISITKARRDENEATIKLSWEQIRAVCYWSVAAINGQKKLKKPSDLFKFSWEKKNSKDARKELK